MRVKVAWVWQPGTWAKRYWLEVKRDGMQYTIDEVAKEHDVLHLCPTGEEPERVGYKFLYRTSSEAFSALEEFDPDVINLNAFGSRFNREIAVRFPEALITLYDHGFHMTCMFSELVDVFFTFQESRRRTLAERSGVPIETVVLNHHGYDPRLFFPDSSVEKTYTGVMVSDFRPIKAQDKLIRDWKGVEGKLLLVGRLHPPLGEPDYVNKCRTLIDGLGLSDRVEIRDFVPHDELPGLINSAMVAIHPAKGGAGGRCTIEMMACGLPMIVYKELRTEEWLKNEDWIKAGGLIEVEHGVDPRQPSSLEATVNQLMNDPDAYRVQSEGTLRAVKPYTYDRMYATFREVIESVYA